MLTERLDWRFGQGDSKASWWLAVLGHGLSNKLICEQRPKAG